MGGRQCHVDDLRAQMRNDGLAQQCADAGPEADSGRGGGGNAGNTAEMLKVSKMTGGHTKMQGNWTTTQQGELPGCQLNLKIVGHNSPSA